MAADPLSTVGPRSSADATFAAVDKESLWLGAAMAHIKANGNLDGLPSSRSERVAVMATVVRRGLVGWDKSRNQYVLTALGQKHLEAYFPGVTKVAGRSRKGVAPIPDLGRSSVATRV